MSGIERTSDVTTRLILQAALLKALKGEHDKLRVEAVESLEPGDKKAPRYRGMKIGTVSLSDPDPEVIVTDRDALDEWVRERRPDLVTEREPRVDPDRMSEAVGILRRHAPELVLPGESVVEDWARVSAARDAVEDGELPPGVDLREKSPVLSVRPDKATGAVVRQFLESSGLLAIEGGESDAQ